MYNQINVQHIKNYFRKPSVLVLTVCKAVTVFISCFLGIFAVGAVNDLLRTLATVSHDADLYEFSSLSVASFIPSVIIDSIIALIPAALWLWIYLSAKSNNINRKPDTVFTVNFVFAVLGIVGSALAIICSGLFFLLGIGMALPYDDMTSSEQEMMSFVSALLIVVSIILLINSVISLIYSIAKAKFFSSAKKSMFSDRVYPSGAVYGIFSIIQAAINLLVCLGTIFFGFVLYNSNEFATDITALSDLLPFIAISKNIPLIIIISGFTGFITVFALVLEGIIALGYNKMAKAVPPTPNFNPYNNGYNQFNQYNQNQYNPNFNGQYNNFNNQNFNQPYQNNQDYNNQNFVNQQPNPNQQTAVPNQPIDNNAYFDGFDNPSQQLSNQMNLENQINNDLNNNPYE